MTIDVEQRVALIDAIEVAYAEAGVSDIYSGAQRLTRWLDKHSASIAAAHSRESLDAFLEISTILMLCAAAPQIIGNFVRGPMVKAAETIPARSGPPTKVTPKIRRRIVAKITALYINNGVRLGHAQTRAAVEFRNKQANNPACPRGNDRNYRSSHSNRWKTFGIS